MAPSESVLDNIEKFTWDSREAVAYEAAVEAINFAIGAYSARLATETSRSTPNRSIIAELQAGQRACALAHDKLRNASPENIAEARRHFTHLAGSVRAQ